MKIIKKEIIGNLVSLNLYSDDDGHIYQHILSRKKFINGINWFKRAVFKFNRDRK